MKTILDKIIEQKKIDIISLKDKFNADQLIKSVEPSEIDFNKSFKKDKINYILECKKASPSKGVINKDFRPKDIAKTYNNFATAISVLTDEKFFQGSFDYLKEVRENSTLPILCKDFIIDPFQIYLARKHGANGILLILAILTDGEYLKLKSVAESLKMGVLTEVANEKEAKRANILKAPIVGINNRNLKDFTIDLNKSIKLSKYLEKDQFVICESGIENFSQIKELSKTVNGFLIGGSLMAKDNLEIACRSLIYGENKVCGIKDQLSAKVIYKAGASYIGLNFVKSSPRFIDKMTAKDIIKSTSLISVGVFQDQAIEEVIDTINETGIDIVQLHGNESIEYINLLKNKISKEVKIWKAISADQISSWNYSKADKTVIDSRTLDQFGGIGKPFDWSKLVNIPKDKIILAGGIGLSNIKEALKLGVVGLDLNSKLESRPGVKCPKKIEEVFKVIKGNL